ncbi:DNA oxidative demethylase ALKBH2-like [Primulina tabacum]|uniref:DNA oxidative demethylase ALKBH2-like n=1 Tax=Primulina tabacum TaxID=48773 RepID=UPI003F5958D1
MFQIYQDTCYVSSEGLTQLVYSGYQPHAYTWNDFPPPKEFSKLGIKEAMIISNDEKLNGPTPQIASHGSLLVRDWFHSVPNLMKAESVRINLTFRRIL